MLSGVVVYLCNRTHFPLLCVCVFLKKKKIYIYIYISHLIKIFKILNKVS